MNVYIDFYNLRDLDYYCFGDNKLICMVPTGRTVINYKIDEFAPIDSINYVKNGYKERIAQVIEFSDSYAVATYGKIQEVPGYSIYDRFKVVSEEGEKEFHVEFPIRLATKDELLSCHKTCVGIVERKRAELRERMIDPNSGPTK